MNFYIGVDESGKGDFFGPLVIAGVVSNEDVNEKLLNAGVKDSKKLSDKKVFEIFERIKEICKFYEVVVIKPKRYNELTRKLNLNKLLAWGHARVIENLLEKAEQENFKIDKIISDQFGDASYLLNALMKRGRKINLIQMHRAEIDPAVASASIIARAVFLNQLAEMSRKYEMVFPKGVSDKVVDVAKEIVKKFGKDELLNVAKIHFKTTSQVL